MKKSIKVMLSAVAAMSAVLPVWGQDQAFTAEQQEAVQRIVASKLPEHMGVGDLKVRSLNIENDTIKVDVSENFGDVPFTEEGVERMRSEIRSALGSEYSDSPVLITIVGNDINKLCRLRARLQALSQAVYQRVGRQPPLQARPGRQHHRHVAQPRLVF